MEVQFTPDQQAFLREAIQSGRIRREEDALLEAMVLWEERERLRSEILAAVDAAETSLSKGDGVELTGDSVRELVADVKRRGRARLAIELPPSR